jgi:transcriptional regulator with XRE-family HTH domain
MSVGHVVRELRLNHGLTQEDVEMRTLGKVKRGYLSKLELDAIAMPSRDKLHALAAALQTTTRYILEQAGFINPVDREIEQRIAAFLDAYPEYQVMFQITQRISPQGRRRLLNYARLIALEEEIQDLPAEARL